jgi:hypothetical protein
MSNFFKKTLDFGKNLITGGAGEAQQGFSQGLDTQERMFNTGRQDLAPWRDFGQNYMGKTNAFLAQPRTTINRPTPESVKSLPGYQFRFDQGKDAIENSAAARGGLLSGNTLRAITDYGQDYASGEYDKALNQYNNDVQLDEGKYQNQFNRLSQLLNYGYGASGGSAGLAQNTGNSMAALQVGRGQAAGQGYQFLPNYMQKFFAGGGNSSAAGMFG